MVKMASFPLRLGDAREERIDTVTQAIWELLEPLPPAEQERVLRTVRPATTPRAGEVLDTVIRLLPSETAWTVGKVRQDVAAAGIEATAKEVYNAVGYLARKGHVRRLGYGRYVVLGVGIITPDDLGGEPARDECY